MENNSVNAEAVEVVAQQTPETVESVQSEVATDKQSPEENSKYAAARREAEAKAKEIEEKAKAYEEKVNRIEQLVKKGGFESVDKFTETYEQQLKQREIEEKRANLESMGVDPDIYEELIANDPRVKKAIEFEQQQEKLAKEQTELGEFLDYFKESNGRDYDSATDKISLEVQEMVNRGVPLVVAYKAAEETTMLKKKLAEMEKQLEARQTNERNSNSTPGGLNGNPADDSFISAETFEANRKNSEWVKKNLEKIIKSRPKWQKGLNYGSKR